MKKIFFAVSAVLILVAFPALLRAAEYLPEDIKNAGNVVVGGAETFRNLYVAGGSVVTNKQVLGDLFVAGGSVNVAGPVEKDLFAAGGNISVSSPVGEDARLAGGNIAISAPVGGDLLVAGGTIAISEAVKVSGDLWAAGGIINVSSVVAGEGRFAGGEIFINGTITGPVEVRAEEKLTFGPQANVVGPITYYGREEAVIEEGAKVGTIDFTQWTREKKSVFAWLSGAVLLKLLAVILAGLILLKIFRTKLTEVISSAREKFWANLGIGIVGFIATPIAAILLAVTLVGVYTGMILGALFALAMLVSGVLVLFFVGTLVERRIKKNQDVPLTWRTVLWGALVSGVVSLIPFIGWLTIFVLCAASFGALLRAFRRRLEL